MHLSLRLKVLFSFLAVAVLVGGTGYYQIVSINSTSAAFGNLVDNDVATLEKLEDIKLDIGDVENAALTYTHEALEHASVSTLSQQQKLVTQAEQNLQYDTATFSKMESGGKDSQNMAMLVEQYVNEATSLVSASTGTFTTNLETHESNVVTSRQSLSQQVDGLITTTDVQINSEDKAIDSDISAISRAALSLTLSTAILSVALGILVASRISRRVLAVTKGAERIANGDLSTPIQVSSHDEVSQLGRSFNAMSERLRESYRRLALQNERDSTLLENLSEGLIAIDPQTNIVLINNQAIQLLDLKGRNEVTNLPINHAMSLYDERDKPLIAGQTPAVAALQTSQQVSGVYGYHKKDGSKILINISANPFVLEGTVGGAIMILRDVTKEKEVDRMKTEFISLASHQLRTPLSAIRWFTEMLLNGDGGELNPEQKEFAQNAYDSTERMIQLVNGLLNISRIESGRIIIDPRPTDLQELVNGIINDLKGKTEEKRQTLIVSAHQGLPKVMLDPHLIGQVYMNLLTNAIKYTPKDGEISVFISRKGNDIVSQVTDNGYGIPKDQQGKMFQKFFRATNVAKVETDGTGLGMYLVKAIVESSGGKIWFESEEGKGTTFWFTLPVTGMKAKEGEVTLDG